MLGHYLHFNTTFPCLASFYIYVKGHTAAQDIASCFLVPTEVQEDDTVLSILVVGGTRMLGRQLQRLCFFPCYLSTFLISTSTSNLSLSSLCSYVRSPIIAGISSHTLVLRSVCATVHEAAAPAPAPRGKYPGARSRRRALLCGLPALPCAHNTPKLEARTSSHSPSQDLIPIYQSDYRFHHEVQYRTPARSICRRCQCPVRREA